MRIPPKYKVGAQMNRSGTKVLYFVKMRSFLFFYNKMYISENEFISYNSSADAEYACKELNKYA